MSNTTTTNTDTYIESSDSELSDNESGINDGGSDNDGSDDIDENDDSTIDDITESESSTNTSKIPSDEEIEKKKKEEIVDKECLYNIVESSKIKKAEIPGKIILPPKKGEKDERITKKVLFYYEKIKIIADRINQLENGAKPMVKNINNLSNKEIALLELESVITYTDNTGEKITNKALPFVLNRKLPKIIMPDGQIKDGTTEVFRLGELKLLE